MCDFIASTNWSNIKHNYFVDAIIIFDLSYYTNITITVTFVNQATLCHAFFFFSPENYPHKSGAIFHIETAPTSLTMWSGRLSFKTNLSESHLAEWIIFALTEISVCSPLFKTPFTTIVLDGFLLSMKGSSLTTWSPFQSCIVPTGDDGSLYDSHSSGKLIVIKISETQLLWKHQSSQNANTGNHTLISCWTMLIGFLYFRETTR